VATISMLSVFNTQNGEREGIRQMKNHLRYVALSFLIVATLVATLLWRKELAGKRFFSAL
jgi:hypothetical protein